MAKESITELNKKETSLIEKYIKLKNEEKKNKENIEALKDDVLSLLKEHEGKVVHNGYNISMHESKTYQYSEAIVNIETEIKVLKQREETLQIASISKITEYAKVYKLKDKNESKNE
ncbi:hypothetical protein OFP91_14550 [Brachyspira hyodysenteriae]|uniref:hypothetical protein n=1 Tax=Brachyspira hyodysenteriae TaxID=159 RepID=UPI0022CD24D0|nr:hypothetical protein [Brachyspira hyodysenteriae]MCZ9877625.1 hypothetical protein [Brachyspira hyodysenteriae]MCZ9879383.1 hypothetical protein [Brachyspira hyodysenteriae]MCZ9880133.1 hypothetical protein [Brachyspira hyodysenteriae]MCZ9896980.1 hypothetical protein [Brachyspira hyodysenteriae]MCZ9899079.1 hypothetical protein [Brachyspira hyodysenteriae]